MILFYLLYLSVWPSSAIPSWSLEVRRSVPSFHLENGNSFFLMIHFLVSTYGDDELNVYCSTETFGARGSFADLSHLPRRAVGFRIPNKERRHTDNCTDVRS